jgi:hypothetical protein
MPEEWINLVMPPHTHTHTEYTTAKNKSFCAVLKTARKYFLFNQQGTLAPGPCGNHFLKVCAEVLKR